LAANGGRLRIAVTDTGVGVPADRIERLFQRFSQVDGSITRQYGGSGLGLAICKKLAELMGGEIGVETEEGRGSTFWFTIAAPAAELSKTAVVGECGNRALAPARILIVDDVSVNRQLVWAMLSPLGLQLTEATSGAEAVEAALSTAFDLILMDLQMPGMDGLAAMRAIRATSELNRATPIVALSANVLPAQVAACRKAGMDDHIAKPIRPEELVGTIARWTDPAAGRAIAETPQA
jgi:CheY-like chemotaxis protein